MLRVRKWQVAIFVDLKRQYFLRVLVRILTVNKHLVLDEVVPVKQYRTAWIKPLSEFITDKTGLVLEETTDFNIWGILRRILGGIES